MSLVRYQKISEYLEKGSSYQNNYSSERLERLERKVSNYTKCSSNETSEEKVPN